MGTGINRAMRRREEREQFKKMRSDSNYNWMLSLQKNGITAQDLDKAYKNGYDDGFLYSAEAFMKKMYAAIAKELIEAGNPTDDVITFVKNVDHRFAIMFDSDDEIDEVYNLIGVRFVIDRNAINRVEEV